MISLTERDTELLQILTHKVSLLTFEQIVESLYKWLDKTWEIPRRYIFKITTRWLSRSLDKDSIQSYKYLHRSIGSNNKLKFENIQNNNKTKPYFNSIEKWMHIPI